MTLMASLPVTRTWSLEALRVRVTGRLTRRDLARKTPARVTVAVRDHASDRHGPSHGQGSLQSHWHSLSLTASGRLAGVTVVCHRDASQVRRGAESGP
jgi:hypothetical protein